MPDQHQMVDRQSLQLAGEHSGAFSRKYSLFPSGHDGDQSRVKAEWMLDLHSLVGQKPLRLQINANVAQFLLGV